MLARTSTIGAGARMVHTSPWRAYTLADDAFRARFAAQRQLRQLPCRPYMLANHINDLPSRNARIREERLPSFASDFRSDDQRQHIVNPTSATWLTKRTHPPILPPRDSSGHRGPKACT